MARYPLGLYWLARMGSPVAQAGSPVVCLFLSGGPPAIFRCIRAIVINSVEGLAGRPGPHVGEEYSKVIPLGADRYTAATVSFVTRTVDVTHALAHRHPGDVFGTTPLAMIRHAMGTGYRTEPSPGLFAITATATGREAPSQIPGPDLSFCSALASAEPEAVADGSFGIRAPRRLGDDSPPAKHLAGQIEPIRGATPFFEGHGQQDIGQ